MADNKQEKDGPELEPVLPSLVQEPFIPEKELTLSVSSGLHKDLINRANIEGLNVNAMAATLLQSALKFESLQSGIVTDLAPDIFDKLKDIFKAEGENMIQACKETDSITEEVKEPLETIKLNPGELIFVTNPDVIELVTKINETREQKQLAPIQKSLCELLLYWSITLSDYDIFETVTGMPYTATKAILKTLALNEREVNGVASNIIVGKGLFGSFDIRESKTENDNGK